MRSLFAFIVLSSIFLCLPAAANAQARHISGTVYYADTGEPADHVFVDLLSAEGLTITTATTNTTGDFSFLGLKPQVYQLSVRSQDYEPVNVSVDLSYTSVNGQSLALQKRGSGAKKPVGQSVSVHMLSLPAKTRNAYDKGNQELYQKDDSKAALADFGKALKKAPGCYECLEGMGWAYAGMNKASDAEKAFRKSIEVGKDNYAPADIGLGVLLINTHQIAEGEKILNRALEVDAKSWRAYYELGRAALMQNKIDEALKNTLQAKALQPKAPAIYRLLAIIHIRQNNAPELLADLDSYIKLDPLSPAGQRARELRDEVAKMVPAKASSPAIQGNTGGANSPSLKKAGDDQSPSGQGTAANPN